MPQLKTDPIVPITSVNFLDPEGKEAAATILQVHREFGIRRFMLIAPGHGMLLTGYRGREPYRRIGEKLRKIKEMVSGHDVQVGWWCMPTLETGKSSFQKITDISGCVSDYDFITACPLDPEYRKVFSENVALVASIARPFMIMMEDDIKVSCHGPVGFACFCPLHLREFAKRVGREYSREELEEIFSKDTPQSRRMRIQWGELSRDSLVGFAAAVREKLDEVAPETRIGLCQSGASGFDGDFTEAVAAAFAGKTRPLVRVYGAEYYSDRSDVLPFTLFNVLYSAQHLPKHFELLHESDPFPAVRFFASAAKLKSLMAGAFSYGLSDCWVLAAQWCDNPFEESAYCAMLRDESARFAALREAVADCRPAGCEICHSQWQHTVVPNDPTVPNRPDGGLNAWIGVLGQFGIPYSVAPGGVKMLAGHIASFLSDDEILAMLSGGVLMDGPAAEVLTRRGFGDLIGVDAEPGEFREIEFHYEKVEEDAGWENVQGRLMPCLMFALYGYEGCRFTKLRPHPQAQVLSSLITPDGKPVMPGMVRFENALGGRVGVITFDLAADTGCSAIYNYRKKEMTRQLLEWLGRKQLPVCVEKLAKIYCILNLPENREKAVVTLINLCSDTAPEAELTVSREWEGCEVTVLNASGKWEPCGVKITDGRATVPVELKRLEPVYLQWKR